VIAPVPLSTRALTADFIAQRELSPTFSLAADRHFMQAVRRSSRMRPAVLRVYSFGGDVVSLGRYHLAPPPPENGGATLWRRRTGGRAVPFGHGFVGLSLVLPHRSALFADDPVALAPYQVMNRYGRGILEALRLVNVPAFYPGRDFITVDRRVVGLVSFETDESGALLFEAILANGRDFSVLPEMLRDLDPAGLIKLEMLTPDATTSLARELGTELSFDEVVEMLRRGFAQQFDLTCDVRDLTTLETRAIEAIAAREYSSNAWLLQRTHRPDLPRHTFLWVQLGALEAHFSLEQERFLKEIVFAGDFLANAPAIERLERELRLCPTEWRAIDTIVNDVFSDPQNYILGIGRLRTIADMITRGAGA